MLEIVRTPEDVQQAIVKDGIANRIGAALHKAYPNRNWLVRVSDDLSLASVHCVDISLEYGMVIHLDIIAHEMEAAAVFAGGECLERFNLSRDRYADDGGELPVDIRGEAIGVKSGELILP
jgi:hypothetical protein